MAEIDLSLKYIETIVISDYVFNNLSMKDVRYYLQKYSA